MNVRMKTTSAYIDTVKPGATATRQWIGQAEPERERAPAEAPEAAVSRSCWRVTKATPAGRHDDALRDVHHDRRALGRVRKDSVDTGAPGDDERGDDASSPFARERGA